MIVAILGCGYTGKRVARTMLAAGHRVVCTSRSPEHLSELTGAELVRFEAPSDASLSHIPEGSHVLYSIPPVDGGDLPVWAALAERRPSRVVYLSTTGVYGDSRDVDERTEPAPRHARDRERLDAEAAALSRPWSSVVLRPAAIYGPGRGIHESMLHGRFRLVGSGDNFVSRIHVDDLAAHVVAAMMSEVGGAWPVADEHPCTSREIAGFCAELLQVPMPPGVDAEVAHHTRRADRRVDGSAIRRELGLTLRFRSYREGIPPSLGR